MPASNCHILFSPDLELLLAAQSLLTGETVHTLCRETWGQEACAARRQQYPALFEVMEALCALWPCWILEPLTHYSMERFSLAHYETHLRSLPAEAIVWDALSLDFFPSITVEDVRLALTDDPAAARLLETVDGKKQIPYLAFRTFLRQLQPLIRDFFSLARSLDTEEFRHVLEEIHPQVEAEQAAAAAGLSQMEPLEYAQSRMGKTFRNRGPYEEYWFLPSWFLPYRALRFFRPGSQGGPMLLILSLYRPADNQKDTVRRLKALADENRYRILAMLNKQGAMRGLDLSKALGLAPSTVSHHMEQLRQAGLVHEETQKDGKYYSANPLAIDALLAGLKSNLQ